MKAIKTRVCYHIQFTQEEGAKVRAHLETLTKPRSGEHYLLDLVEEKGLIPDLDTLCPEVEMIEELWTDNAPEGTLPQFSLLCDLRESQVVGEANL